MIHMQDRHTGMNRRTFMRLAVGSLGVAALSACLPRAPATGSRVRTPSSHASMDAKSFNASRRFQATSFGNIAYVEQGSGEAALFLHGFPLNGFQWRGALPRLADARRCIAPDFLGLGYTQVADGQSVAPAMQADMLAAFMDGLGIARADI